MYLRVRLLLFSSIVVLCAGNATPLARAQDSASARLFVESLYRLYTKNGRGVPSTGPEAHLYYHSSLLELWAADVKANGSDNVPAVEADPVCDCQDWSGVWDLKVDIQSIENDRAVVKVSFALSAPKNGTSNYVRRVTMTLAPENGQWRIWNLVDQSDPKAPFDVRKALTDDIRSLGNQQKR